MTNEHHWIQAAKKGDDDAFSKLFQAHYSFLFNYLIKATLDPNLAEDLIQETMLKAYLHLIHFKGESKFSTWLISIASRLLIDERRRRKSEHQKLTKMKDETIRKMKWNVNVNGYEWTESMALFAELDVSIRTPIILHHYYGFTYEEIANMLNLRVGTVKTRVHHGIKKIRKRW